MKNGLFRWVASGRAIANGGDMVSEIALAIEMGADVVDIGKTIHLPPTLGDSISMAAEVHMAVVRRGWASPKIGHLCTVWRLCFGSWGFSAPHRFRF